jgi:hypothetical protein
VLKDFGKIGQTFYTKYYTAAQEYRAAGLDYELTVKALRREFDKSNATKSNFGGKKWLEKIMTKIEKQRAQR